MTDVEQQLQAQFETETQRLEELHTNAAICVDQLAEMYALRDSIGLKKQALRDQVLTAEIKAQLADIDAELAPDEDEITRRIRESEDAVRHIIIGCGQTITGERLQAVYVRGRVSWDTKALDGYCVDHPDLTRFRREGEPSVSIRKK